MNDFKERREFEREKACIPFVYSLDGGESLADGEWMEAETLDIGPVLVGGLGFESDDKFEIGQRLRVALFMNLRQREVWAREQNNFPIIYHAKVVRLFKSEEGKNVVGVVFGGFADKEEGNDE